MTETRERFVPTYAPELAQYVVTRGDVRVIPTKAHSEDDALIRAAALSVSLNKLYAEPSPERATPGAGCPQDGCRYPACNCALERVPAQRWTPHCHHDTDFVCARGHACDTMRRFAELQRLREADGAELADEEGV